MNKLKMLCIISALLLPLAAGAVTLTLDGAIRLANDSSLMAFRYRNMYQASRWQYVSFRADRLPSLTLNATPARYYRYMTQRYNSEENIDVFRQQQMFSASAGLEVKQNFDLLGGFFYLDTKLEYMRNFGQTKYTQFSSVPVRVGYSQSLLGFNAFKWERKIEPLRYETAKKELIYRMEEDLTATVEDYNVKQSLIASAQEALDLAETAYAQTRQRFIIGKADINSITLSLNRRQEASKNYIAALQNFWLSHYKIRRLTLHDFVADIPLAREFDFQN